MKVETHTYADDAKCGGCNWSVSRLFSFPTNNIDETGLCAECFMDMIVKEKLAVIETMGILVEKNVSERSDSASTTQKFKAVSKRLKDTEEALQRINKKYLDWYNSDSYAISKHTAETIFEIGEILKSYREGRK